MIDVGHDRLDLDLRVDRRSLLAAAMALGRSAATSCFVEQHLPLQVVELEKIAIDDPQLADAGAGQRVGEHRPQRPAAADERPAGQQAPLPLFAERREANLPHVAVELVGGSHDMSSQGRGRESMSQRGLPVSQRFATSTPDPLAYVPRLTRPLAKTLHDVPGKVSPACQIALQAIAPSRAAAMLDRRSKALALARTADCNAPAWRNRAARAASTVASASSQTTRSAQAAGSTASPEPKYWAKSRFRASDRKPASISQVAFEHDRDDRGPTPEPADHVRSASSPLPAQPRDQQHPLAAGLATKILVRRIDDHRGCRFAPMLARAMSGATSATHAPQHVGPPAKEQSPAARSQRTDPSECSAAANTFARTAQFDPHLVEHGQLGRPEARIGDRGPRRPASQWDHRSMIGSRLTSGAVASSV